MPKLHIEKNTVQETLVIPLYGRKLACEMFPGLIGDTKAAFKRFDRQQMEIKISDVAAVEGFNAFQQNGALIRAFFRDDASVFDYNAFVYGQIAFHEETEGTGEG